MIQRVSIDEYYRCFVRDSHLFISRNFIELHSSKVDELFFLISEDRRLGIIFGKHGNLVKSPISAPFGGIHYKSNLIHSSDIDRFLINLNEFFQDLKISSIHFTLPPDLYEPHMNAKLVSAFIRLGVIPNTPEITQWIDLHSHDLTYPSNVQRAIRHASTCGLSFQFSNSRAEQQEIYSIIRDNRTRQGRPIYMSIEDLITMEQFFPVDYGIVRDSNGTAIAGSIFYRVNNDLIYPVFWGDSELGRTFHAMDFLADSLWNHYKQCGYHYIDLGISTESGVPNPGLLRFKESIGGVSSLRYTFDWRIS